MVPMRKINIHEQTKRQKQLLNNFKPKQQLTNKTTKKNSSGSFKKINDHTKQQQKIKSQKKKDQTVM